MATQTQRLQDLATRIATECKSLRTIANGNAADNSALLTTVKTSLVAAINEVKQQANSLAASGGATINDASTASTSQTYSITKILSAISDARAALKAEILGGAGSAFDTLQELKDLLDGEAAQITNIMTALGNRVRTDVATQGLTTVQKQNARTNIDAYGSTELGNPDTNLVTTFETGLAS